MIKCTASDYIQQLDEAKTQSDKIKICTEIFNKIKDFEDFVASSALIVRIRPKWKPSIILGEIPKSVNEKVIKLVPDLSDSEIKTLNEKIKKAFFGGEPQYKLFIETVNKYDIDKDVDQHLTKLAGEGKINKSTYEDWVPASEINKYKATMLRAKLGLD